MNALRYFFVFSCLTAITSLAQVPPLINYQGRVVVGGTNFEGTGQFKFALVNSAGSVTFWSNDGTSVGGNQPTAFVNLGVNRGLYSILLGDTTVAGMPTALPIALFTNSDVRLRVWFNDGVTGFQQFTPDQRLAAVGYAMMAANVPDGVITSNKLAPNSVGAAQIADGSITSAELALNTITSSNLADSISLGQTNVNGRLDVYRNNAGTPGISLIGSTSQISTYGNLGQEKIRLWGNNFGEMLLYNSLSNNAVAVKLTSQGTTGGQLELRNTNGSIRALLEGENTGGALTLFQADGSIGALVDGDSGGAGLMQLRNTNGSTRISVYGQSPGGSGGEISINNGSGVEGVELIGTSTGGSITTKDPSGVTKAQLASSSAGGYIYLYQTDNNIGLWLDGDSGGAGAITINNTNGSARVYLDGQSTAGGGEISVRDTSGTETVEIIGAENSTEGGQIILRDAAGGTTVQIDGDEGGAGNGYISIYGTNGAQNIILDGNSSGDGRIICDVLQINGGSDLSERFDIRAVHQPLKPGMIVSIDPDKPGDLLVSQKAYDRTVAGIISGAGGVKPGMLMGQTGTKADGQHPVALTGRVYCYVDADAGGSIEPGDMITTSATPGHGMKVNDYAKAGGAIIGKAMSKLEKGKGLVLVLVSLQ